MHEYAPTNSISTERIDCALLQSGIQVVDLDLRGHSYAQTWPFSVQNRPKIHFHLLIPRSYSRLGFYRPWYWYTCSCMPDGGVSWLHLAGLWPRGKRIFSISVNNFSFLKQMSNEQADARVAGITTHTLHTYHSIIIPAFLLVLDLQKSDRAIFQSAKEPTCGSISAAFNARGLNSIAPSSLSLYYHVLGSQPLVVFPFRRI
jgi:hypothetical protein